MSEFTATVNKIDSFDHGTHFTPAIAERRLRADFVAKVG
jgi:hypothetical protein